MERALIEGRVTLVKKFLYEQELQYGYILEDENPLFYEDEDQFQIIEDWERHSFNLFSIVAISGNIPLAEFLLEYVIGKFPPWVSYKKDAVSIAIIYGNYELAEWMIRNNFDIERSHKWGSRPIDYAIIHNNLYLVKLLREHNSSGPRAWAMKSIVENDSWEILHYISKNGIFSCDVDDKIIREVFYSAVISEKYDMANFILHKGIRFDKEKKDELIIKIIKDGNARSLYYLYFVCGVRFIDNKFLYTAAILRKINHCLVIYYLGSPSLDKNQILNIQNASVENNFHGRDYNAKDEIYYLSEEYKKEEIKTIDFINEINRGSSLKMISLRIFFQNERDPFVIDVCFEKFI